MSQPFIITGAGGGSGTTPTGTGFRHVTSGTEDGASKLVNLTAATDVAANQGTTTTVLHGNAAGQASFAAVSLTADVSGILPLANGGTNVNLSATGSATAFLAQDASHVVSARSITGADLPNPSAVGQAWFWGASGVQNIAGGSGVGVGTSISGCMVWIPTTITVRKVSIRTVTGVAVTTMNCAIYTADGNTKLIDANISTASSGATVTTTLGAPVTLTPGWYIYAYACSSASVTAVEESIPNVANFMNTNSTKAFVGTGNGLSGGVMPSTLGALSANTSATKILALFES